MKKLIFTLLALAITASPALAQGKGHGHGNANASAHRDGDDHGRADRDRDHDADRDRDADRDHDRDADRDSDRDSDHGRGKHHAGDRDGRAPIFGVQPARNTPPGWSKGKKTGWGNCDVPPGQAKKVGCRSTGRIIATRRPTTTRRPRVGVTRDGQVVISPNRNQPQQPAREFNDPRHATQK